MSVYVIHFIVNMCIAALLLGRHQDISSVRKKRYLIITTIQYGLLAGFRSVNVGIDTKAYYYSFTWMPGIGETLASGFKVLDMEIGYALFNSIVKAVGGNFQIVLIVASLFIMSSVCLFIYRHSVNIWLSVYIILCFPFFYSSMDIIRFYLATSFFLLGYRYIEERKLRSYILFLLVGSLFHVFIWLFLPMYWLRRTRWNLKAFVVGICAMLVFLELLKYMQPVLIKLLGYTEKDYSYWVGSYSGGIKSAVMYFVIFLLAVVLFYSMKIRAKQDGAYVKYIFSLFLLAVIFTRLRMAYRFICAFIPLLSISMPKLLRRENIVCQTNYTVVHVSFLSIALLYHYFLLTSNWQQVVPYMPFWRE